MDANRNRVSFGGSENVLELIMIVIDPVHILKPRFLGLGNFSSVISLGLRASLHGLIPRCSSLHLTLLLGLPYS